MACELNQRAPYPELAAGTVLDLTSIRESCEEETSLCLNMRGLMVTKKRREKHSQLCLLAVYF